MSEIGKHTFHRLAIFFKIDYGEVIGMLIKPHRIIIDKKERKIDMKFNCTELEKEYYRYCSQYPDLEYISHPLINVSDTLRAYFALADYFTDSSSETTESMLIGIRSMDLLYSALGRQCTTFGNRTKYNNPIDICSTLFFGMVKNHSFSDGNKRTALLILLYQLNLYNYLPNAPVKEYEKLVVATAANELPKQYEKYWKKYRKFDDPEVKTIAHFLRKNTTKKDHSYHLDITARDMKDALENYGVKCFVGNGKIHFERTLPKKWFKDAEVLRFATNFGGWTRSFGASTAREILSSLQLYDQIPDYQAFINGNELFYSLIQNFEGPLRRLKDE